MTTFIKTKFKKSDDQTNIDIYRVAANITECHINLKLINLESPKNLILIKILQDITVASLCTRYLIAKGIITESLSSIGQF